MLCHKLEIGWQIKVLNHTFNLGFYASSQQNWFSRDEACISLKLDRYPVIISNEKMKKLIEVNWID